MGGNPFGKDVFKYGSDDWQARKQYDQWRAQKNPPSTSSGSSWVTSNRTNYGSSGVQNYSSSSGGSSLGKLLLGGVVVVAALGYFGSDSKKQPSQPDVRSRYQTSQSQSYETRTRSQPRQADYNESTRVAATASQQAVTPPARLPENDQRVGAALDDLQALSKQSLFVANGGETLVIEGNLNTPQRNMYQMSFSVGDLDVYHATYERNSDRLNIPCKQNAVCISYNVYQGSTEQAAGSREQHGTYASINLWSPSSDAANRMLQDFQQLQNLRE